jgi:hypothetical protein
VRFVLYAFRAPVPSITKGALPVQAHEHGTRAAWSGSPQPSVVCPLPCSPFCFAIINAGNSPPSVGLPRNQ